MKLRHKTDAYLHLPSVKDEDVMHHLHKKPKTMEQLIEDFGEQKKNEIEIIVRSLKIKNKIIDNAGLLTSNGN